MNEPKFNVASIKLSTRALGPGDRLAIWFQGCNIGCKGCCNPELQPLVPKHIMRLDEVLSVASQAKRIGVEGVTLIGGEPTLQAGLPTLTEGLQALGLGVIMFTGKLLEDLDPNLLAHMDTVIDGKFEAWNRDRERNLVGSRNQRIINITDRYAESDWFTELRDDFVEIDVGDGLMIANGSAFRFLSYTQKSDDEMRTIRKIAEFLSPSPTPRSASILRLLRAGCCETSRTSSDIRCSP